MTAVPFLPSDFRLQDNNSLRKIFPDFRFLDQLNKQGNWISQTFLHFCLLRNFQPRPKFPQGLYSFLLEKFKNQPHVKEHLGPEPPEVPGLAPQWSLMVTALEKMKPFYEKYTQLSRFILVSTNTGAGKTGFDWPVSFLYRDAMPHWPPNPEGEIGLPPILIISANTSILKNAYIPFLRERYPFCHPDVFVILNCHEVKQQRGYWIRKQIEKIIDEKKGGGILALAMSPQCLKIELQKYLKKGHWKSSAYSCLTNVRLLILDEVDQLGVQYAEKKLGSAVGKLNKIGDKCQEGSGNQALALAYVMAHMKKSFPEQHLIVGLSATIAQGELAKSLPNYIALAGGGKELATEFTEHCLTSYIAPSIAKVNVTVERCTMTPLSLKIHDLLIDANVNQEDSNQSHFSKKALIQHGLSASLGAHIMLDPDSSFTETLTALPNGTELLKELKKERKETSNPMIQLAVQRTIQHIQQAPENKIIVFYSRRKIADIFRKELVKDLKSDNDETFVYQDVSIFSGSVAYPEATYTGDKAFDRFKKSKSTSLLDQVLLMSCTCGRGQNLGMANKVLLMGAMMDTKAFVQDLGRMLRAGCTGSKEIHFIIPQKEFLTSEKVLALMLNNMYCQGDVAQGEIWAPLLSVANQLAQVIDEKLKPKENTIENKKMARDVYNEIRQDWLSRRKPKKRKKPESVKQKKAKKIKSKSKSKYIDDEAEVSGDDSEEEDETETVTAKDQDFIEPLSQEGTPPSQSEFSIFNQEEAEYI